MKIAFAAALALSCPSQVRARPAAQIEELAEFLPLERDARWEYLCLMKRDGRDDYSQALSARVASVAREEDALSAELEWSGPAYASVKRLLPTHVAAKLKGLYAGEDLWLKHPPLRGASWECAEEGWQCGQEPREGRAVSFKRMHQKVQGETDISKTVEWVFESGKGLARFSQLEETMMGVEWSKASVDCRRATAPPPAIPAPKPAKKRRRGGST